MRPTASVPLALRELAAAPGRSIIAGLGIALGVAVLVVIVALGLGARELVLGQVVQQLPVDTIEVTEKTVDLGLFRLDTQALFGKRPLGPDVLEQLRQIPGVKAAFAQLDVRLPLGARGGARLFGRHLYTDLLMTGVEPELIHPEVGEGFADTSDVVPVVISNQLIEIYNHSLAPSLGTPQLTAHTLTGFEFELVVGRSLMLGTRHARRVGSERARIVGASRYAMRLGVTVPIATARRLVRKYGSDDAPDQYRSVLLKARSAAEVPAIAAAVEALGLAVDKTAETTRDVLTAATLLASLVGFLVLALAGLNIAHSFFAALSERRRELAVLRAVGARRADLVLLVVSQAAWLGLAGGVAGLAVARGAAAAIDAGVGLVLPDFPFKPESFFAFPPWLLGVALLSAIAAAVGGALWPAVRAATAPVARSLSDL